MNQIIRPATAFRHAEPAGVAAAPVPRIAIGAGAGRPGLLARLSERFRHYLRVRRTIRALDGLSEAQLKDIGYRRVPGHPSGAHYERLP